MPNNDNDLLADGLTPPMPDPHGQAALLLVESLMHGLLERSVIRVDDAVQIVESAESVQVDVAEAADGAGAPMWRAKGLLSAIGESFKLYGSGGDGAPPPLRSV